jgi:cell division protein FtsB
MTAVPTLDPTNDAFDSRDEIDDALQEPAHAIDDTVEGAPTMIDTTDDLTDDSAPADDTEEAASFESGADESDTADDAGTESGGEMSSEADDDQMPSAEPSIEPRPALEPPAPRPTLPAAATAPATAKSVIPAPPALPPTTPFLERPAPMMPGTMPAAGGPAAGLPAAKMPASPAPTGPRATGPNAKSPATKSPATKAPAGGSSPATMRKASESAAPTARGGARERTHHSPTPRRATARPVVLNPAFEGDKGSALNRLPKLPFELALLFLIATLLLATFAVVTKISLANAEKTNTASEAQIADLTAQQSATDAELEALRNGAEAVTPPVTPAPSEPVADNSAELDELRTTVDELETENAALAADNDGLRNELAAVPAPTVVAPAPDVEPSPSFDRLLGEEMSAPGGSRLNALENECLGHFVIDDIGLEAIGAGLHTSRTSSANDAVVASMLRGADACSIDPSRIFRQ